MSYPHITFKKSALRDFKTLQAFTEDAEYDDGRNLDWAIFQKYPHIKRAFINDGHYKIKNVKALRQFIDKKYQTQQKIMDAALIKHEKRWKQVASDYFTLVDRLFRECEWPRGKYIAYGTIWGMYPRFLEDKTFQIPFRHPIPQYVIVIIAHELLHFIFYDYFYKRYPKYLQPQYNFLVWHISEIFNTIIQNSLTWRSCFKLKSLGYPEHTKIVTRITRVLPDYSKWNLDVIIDKIIREVLDQKSNLHIDMQSLELQGVDVTHIGSLLRQEIRLLTNVTADSLDDFIASLDAMPRTQIEELLTHGTTILVVPKLVRACLVSFFLSHFDDILSENLEKRQSIALVC